MTYQGPGSRPLGNSLYGGSDPLGGMGGMGTQFGGGSMGGGGITYGMASSQGGVFGAAAPSQSANVFRGTTFGDNSGSIAGAASGIGN